jgi:hypothetical protein
MPRRPSGDANKCLGDEATKDEKVDRVGKTISDNYVPVPDVRLAHLTSWTHGTSTGHLLLFLETFRLAYERSYACGIVPPLPNVLLHPELL